MSQSSSMPLSGLRLGIGRRTTMPVQPISHDNSSIHQHKDAISPAPYKPPHFNAPTASTPTSHPASPSRYTPTTHGSHHTKSLTMTSPPSPFQPQPPSSPSPPHSGGRLNDLLHLGRTRAVSADSYAASSQSQSQSQSSGDSSGGSSVASSPEPEQAEQGTAVVGMVGRQLVRAGQLRKRSPRGLQLWQSRYCWLYSDTLQYSKTRDSRAMQGAIPLAAILSVQSAKSTSVSSGATAEKQRRRFDVLLNTAVDSSSSSGGRVFHFEASNEHDADEWVIALTQAWRRAATSPRADSSRRTTPDSNKFWKAHTTHTSSGRLTVSGLPPQHPSSASASLRVSVSAVARPSSAERRRTDDVAMVQRAINSYVPSISVSHWSINSNSPSTSMSAATATPGPISPIRAPTVHGDLPPSLITAVRSADSPVSASQSCSIASIPSLLPSASSLTASRYSDDRSSPLPPAAPLVPAMLDVVQRVDFHPVGDWFLCRDKSTTDSAWYLMHATHQTHPLFPALSAATIATPPFTSDPSYLLHRLASFTSADAVFALYTPAFRPSDTLLSYLHTHRRLPEPAVRYVAVHVIRALLSLHTAAISYPLLSPASLAFDGEASIYLTDPLPTLSQHPQLPEYQLHARELEGPTADWWRLGVLLYELAVGFPPVRAEEGGGEEGRDEWDSVAEQMERFHPMTLPFPPFVSAGLQSLIRQLLMADRSDRLGCGELADAEVTQHQYFDGVQWTADSHDSLAPPPWVRQHVLRQTMRASQTAKNVPGAPPSTTSSGPSSTTSTPMHVTRPHASSAFTFSPVATTPGAERKLFFPSSLQVVNSLSPIDAYMQQLKPPRHILRLPSASPLTATASASSHRPTALHLTLLGGRGFPAPKDDESAAAVGAVSSSLQRIKRRTLGEKGLAGLKEGLGQQQGVYVAVQCIGEEEEAVQAPFKVRATRLVVGPAACQPSFGDSFLFALPGDTQQLDSAELSLEIRHARVGSQLSGDNGAVGLLVGSVSVPVHSLQSAVTASDAIWHSVISSQGLVVGEVHVKYSFTYERSAETVRRQWWTTAEVQQDETFEAQFGVQLTMAAQQEVPAEPAGCHQLSVVVEAREDASRQPSMCLPAGGEAQLLDASALDQDTADFHPASVIPLNANEMFEPQERTAIADSISCSTATLLSARPSAPEVQLLRSVLCNNKQRAEHRSISVDLSPITPQLIAFASPVTIPALTAYRNPLSHIQLYLQAVYPTQSSDPPTTATTTTDSPTIRIYNLNASDSSTQIIAPLGSSAVSFAPSSVPGFESLLGWCGEVQGWLRGGGGRVVGVHCLSGVWRCCVVVCAYLLFDGQVATVADAISLFCRQRLTPTAAASFTLLPSHRRWLHYIERYTHKLRRHSLTSTTHTLQPTLPTPTPAQRALHLTHVRLAGFSTSYTNPLWDGGRDHGLWYVVVHGGASAGVGAGLVLYDSRVLGSTAGLRERGGGGVGGSGGGACGGGRDVVTSGCEVSGEFRLSVCCEGEVRASCWLHSFFVGDDMHVKLRRDELDWPAGGYRDRRAGSSSAVDDVSVECFFTAA